MNTLVVLLLVLGLVVAAPALALDRPRLLGTGIGLGFGLLVGVAGVLIAGVSDLSEEPPNELGNPYRVHVRNESAVPVVLVPTDADNPAVERVAPGDLAIIEGASFPRYDNDLACTDHPMAIARIDRTVLATIDTCYPMGRNVVVWDGTAAFVDPDARPPLVDPEDAPLVYGGLGGLTLAFVGAGGDVVNLAVRRRRRARPVQE